MIHDDDAISYTEEWLYEMGFADDRSGTPTRGDLHIRPAEIMSGHVSYPAYACIRSLPIPVPKTRGDVRQLCRLLGLEILEKRLTEPGADRVE